MPEETPASVVTIAQAEKINKAAKAAQTAELKKINGNSSASTAVQVHAHVNEVVETNNGASVANNILF